MDALTVVTTQLSNNFCLSKEEKEKIRFYHEDVQRKAVKSMSAFSNKYFEGIIKPFNSVMYCNYLYQLSHKAYLDGETEIADKVYYLNKMLNAVDIFYAIELPEHWSCEHPVGSVLGRANYGDNFFFYQGCTVGGNYKGGKLFYPTIGKNVIMYSNSKILGDCNVGDNVIVSANAYIKDVNIPANSIVFGQDRNIIIKTR